jgi:hypothetical protein
MCPDQLLHVLGHCSGRQARRGAAISSGIPKTSHGALICDYPGQKQALFGTDLFPLQVLNNLTVSALSSVFDGLSSCDGSLAFSCSRVRERRARIGLPLEHRNVHRLEQSDVISSTIVPSKSPVMTEITDNDVSLDVVAQTLAQSQCQAHKQQSQSKVEGQS